MDTVLRDIDNQPTALLGEASDGWYVKHLETGHLVFPRFFSTKTTALMAWDAVRMNRAISFEELAGALIILSMRQAQKDTPGRTPNEVIQSILLSSGTIVMGFEEGCPSVTPHPMHQKFDPGVVRVSSQVASTPGITPSIVGTCIGRFLCGDWGITDDGHARANDAAVENGGPIQAIYLVEAEGIIYYLKIETAPDRRNTQVRLWNTPAGGVE